MPHGKTFLGVVGGTLTLSLCFGWLVTQPARPAHAADSPWQASYQTTFSDLSKYEIGNWHGSTDNGELETYTPSQVKALPGGGVQLTADRSGSSYVSGLIQTQGYITVTPGSYVQATYQVPKGQGFWPAFWLWNYGSNSRTEFDISEIVSNATTTTEASIHANTAPQDRDKDYHSPVDLSTGFHTYAMWWETGFIAFSVDGNEFYRETTNIPTEKMFVIFNLAVGGNWPGSPNSSTPFPSTMTIKNFSVLTHAAAVPSAPPVQGTTSYPTATPSTATPSTTTTSTPTSRPTRRPSRTPTPGTPTSEPTVISTAEPTSTPTSEDPSHPTQSGHHHRHLYGWRCMYAS